MSITERTRAFSQRAKNSIVRRARECYQHIHQPAVNRRLSRLAPGLVLYDNHFPERGIGFQYAELSHYLSHFAGSVLITPGLHWLSRFDDRLAAFEQQNPELRGRVLKIYRRPDFEPRLCYTTLLYQTRQLWEMISDKSARLAFTLNPGGGFSLTDSKSRNWLLEIFASRNFRHAFATQQCTVDYLCAMGLKPGKDFTFIYGSLNFDPPVRPEDRRWHGMDARPLQIGFAGYKYMPGGLNKGFDIFCKVAALAHRDRRHWQFHSWGTLDAADAPWPDLAEKQIQFKGKVLHHTLSEQLREMDVFLSPNRPDAIFPGGFDGFPLGTCIQAGKAGCVMIITDPLKLNGGRFTHGQDLLLIEAQPDPDPEEIYQHLLQLDQNPALLRTIANHGTRTLDRFFSVTAQLEPRKAILQKILEE